MALYLNGKKLLNSLVIDGDTDILEVPYVVSAGCVNKSTINSITFTITENGTYQLYVFWTNNTSTGTISEISTKVNGETITLSNTNTFAYGELNLSVNDVVTISNTEKQNNRGLMAFLLKNADISKFEVIGSVSNNGSTFSIPPKTLALECYQYSFYSGANRYHYMIVADATESIITPNSALYYYGGTWAIRV